MTTERAGRAVNFIPGLPHGPLRGGLLLVRIAVLDEDASLMNDKDASVALKSHWEPVFHNVVGDRRAVNRFSRFVQKCTEGIEPLGREGFRLICGVARRSAPGPDGIGHMAWRAGGETAADIVYDCYKQIFDGGEVPSWFHRSTLVFIPIREILGLAV